MPGTTPRMALPFPVDADPIDVAGDILDLATALDAFTFHIDSGSAEALPSPIPGNTPRTTLHVAVAPNLPFRTRMVVVAFGWVGSDSSSVAFGMMKINVALPGITGPTSPAVNSAGASSYAPCVCTFSWEVPANGTPQYGLGTNFAGGFTGQTYDAAMTTWSRYRIPP